GQLRADVHYGLLPVLVAGPAVTREELLRQRRAIVEELDSLTRRRDKLRELQNTRDRLERELNRVPVDKQEPVLEELRAAERQIQDLSIEREELLRRDVKRIDQGLLTATPEEREASLRRLAERYRNVHVVPPALFLDAEALKRILPALITEAVGP